MMLSVEAIQREQMVLEMLHEKNQAILNLNDQIQGLNAKVQELTKEIEEVKSKQIS